MSESASDGGPGAFSGSIGENRLADDWLVYVAMVPCIVGGRSNLPGFRAEPAVRRPDADPQCAAAGRPAAPRTLAGISPAIYFGRNDRR